MTRVLKNVLNGSGQVGHCTNVPLTLHIQFHSSVRLDKTHSNPYGLYVGLLLIQNSFQDDRLTYCSHTLRGEESPW